MKRYWLFYQIENRDDAGFHVKFRRFEDGKFLPVNRLPVKLAKGVVIPNPAANPLVRMTDEFRDRHEATEVQKAVEEVVSLAPWRGRRPVNINSSIGKLITGSRQWSLVEEFS